VKTYRVFEEEPSTGRPVSTKTQEPRHIDFGGTGNRILFNSINDNFGLGVDLDNDEGKKCLGQRSVTTDASRNVNFTATTPVIPAGEVVTATATTKQRRHLRALTRHRHL
jgi:hypothetical protein